MSLGREEILQHALGLSPEDRAFVVAALVQSLGDRFPDQIAEDSPDAIRGVAFLQELNRRFERFQSGETIARPAEEVLAELYQRQAAEDRH